MSASVIVPVDECFGSFGAIVTGYTISKKRPSNSYMWNCNPTVLLRIYTGYGKVRAESAPSRTGKGFGILIGGAEIMQREKSQGLKLWLRLQD